MDMFLQGLQMALTPEALIVIVAGAVVALITGALPGMGAGLTMALAIPLTFYMSPSLSLMLMGAIYTTCVYGGGITAILMEVPGTSGSAATCLDGYPMSKQGKAGTALGISLSASTLGALASTLLLMIFANLLLSIVLLFGPAEYFWTALMGLTIIVSVSQGAFLKGLIAASIGFLLSTVGMDPITGASRYTFGTLYLQDGLDIIPVLLGMFAMSQVLNLVEKKQATISETGKISGSVLEGLLAPFRYLRTTVRSIILGFVIGALPGVGYSVSNWIAYGMAKQTSSHPETFGHGDPEGVLAPEAANNATVGGALVPTLVLGIPGGETTAILLGSMLLHGLTPGLDLYTKNGPIVYAFYISLIVSSLVMFLLGFIAMRHVARLTTVPLSLLIPIIAILIFTGAFSINYNIMDVVMVVVLGLMGYGFRTFGYPPVCAVLAFILGPILEKNFNRAMILSQGTLLGLVPSPLSWALVVLTIVFLGYGIYTEYFRAGRKPIKD